MPLSIIAAFLSNTVTLFGVLWFGWDISWLLFLYAIESIVVGIFNLKKIQLASAKPKPHGSSARNAFITGSINMSMTVNGKAATRWGSREFVQFFAVAYNSLVGTFMLLLVMLFPFVAGDLKSVPLWLVGVVVQHWSILSHYRKNHEYKTVTKAQQMLLPFTRLFILGVPVIVGLSMQQEFSQLIVALLLVGCKFLSDVLFILKPATFLVVRYGDSEEVIGG